MNLALLGPEDLTGEYTARITGRRLQHIKEVINGQSGDELTVGILNGKIGKGRITSINDHLLEIDIRWTAHPPAPLPANLIIALPRPKMLKRILQTCATMGVKNLYFINSYKVEKSFWKSPLLTHEKIKENLILGLEQAKDTIMPSVHLRSLFKPFVEDELPDIIKDTMALVAHPGGGTTCPQPLNQPATLAIGPEGGFTPYEVGKLMECGFQQIHLGSRILRVETAVPVLLAKLFS